MTDLLDTLGERIKALEAGRVAYSTLFAFILYLFGYLAVRFHLTALGIGTDLAVLDERYVFTGARFLIYFAASIPSIVLLALLVAGVVFIPYRLLPKMLQTPAQGAALWLLQRLSPLWATQRRLTLSGIVLSVISIQFVMRQCFFLSNLLLAPRLPAAPEWVSDLLTASDGTVALYFAGILALTSVPTGVFIILWLRPIEDNTLVLLRALLGLLVTAQLLLLPINFGYFVVDKSLPRVAALGEATPLPQGAEAWLAWNGKNGITYLVSDPGGGTSSRFLITVPHEEVKRVKIIGYDHVFRRLFGAPLIAQPMPTGAPVPQDRSR